MLSDGIGGRSDRIAILQHCEVLAQSAGGLQELGYQLEAAQILVQHATIVRCVWTKVYW